MLQKLSNRIKQQKGFTIIEVMIVLAIAGLIMVVVLIAVPQLQRSQRDSTRQTVVNRLSTELGTYSSNNNGKYPFTAADSADFLTRYITGKVELKNPQTGDEYAIVFATDAATAAANPTAAQIKVLPGLSCSGETATGTFSATSRQYAAVVQLERSGIFYCIDNN